MAGRGRTRLYDWQLSVNFDKEQKAWIKRTAAELDVPYAEAVRVIFDRGIAHSLLVPEVHS